MFYKQNTNVFITSLDIASEADLVKLNATNTFKVSTLLDIGVQAQSQTYKYDSSYLAIGDSVNRGYVTSPGGQCIYTINMDTNLCLANNVVNNENLWHYLLTGLYSNSSSVKSGYISCENNYSQLSKFSIIVVNSNYCKIYTGCNIAEVSFSLDISELASVSWSIISNNVLSTEALKYTTDLVRSNGTKVSYSTDTNIQYTYGKTAVLHIDTYKLGCTSIDLKLSNNIGIVEDTSIGEYGIKSSYQLGGFSITGNASLYTRLGSSAELLEDIASAHSSGSGKEYYCYLVLSGTNQNKLKITLGDTHIGTPIEDISNVFIASLLLDVNNYSNNYFKIEKV